MKVGRPVLLIFFFAVIAWILLGMPKLWAGGLYIRAITYTPTNAYTNNTLLPPGTLTIINEIDCGTLGILHSYVGLWNNSLQPVTQQISTFHSTSCWSLYTQDPALLNSDRVYPPPVIDTPKGPCTSCHL